MDGIWVFVGAGGGIGALVGLALMTPAILPRLFGNKDKAIAGPDRLRATVTVYDQLDDKTRKRLQQQTAHFLKKKKLQAEGGKLPPILATAIAGNACLLRLQPGADCYPGLREVLLSEGETRISRKRLELNWSQVQSGIGSARNPVVRAFAQILHDAPNSRKRNTTGVRDREQWQRAFKAEAEQIDAAESPVFAEYGKEVEDDLFASACEAFFQRGDHLARHHPKLYTLLSEYFSVESA